MTPKPTLTQPEGVPHWAWEKLARPLKDRWAIDERDAQGEVIGTAYRFPDGRKGFQKGGRRGLIYSHPLAASAGQPVFVCEGASDTAAVIGLGLEAVGVPMAGQCGETLTELLRGRRIVIIRDADTAGTNGTERLVRATQSSCESVKVIDPPLKAKDAREAILKGATAQDFLESVEQADSIPVPLLGSGLTGNEFRLIRLGELPASREPDWIWEGVIARGGITLLTGLWKSGKSTLLAHLLRDLYQGSGLVGSTLDGPVIIVSEEPTELWSARRDKLGLDRERICFLQRPSLARCSPAQWAELVDTLLRAVQVMGAVLVVFDTLPGIWPVAEENNASEVLEALMPLRDIAQAGAGLLLIHHPRKSEASGFTSARGSGALSGFPDILAEFGRVPGDPKSNLRTLSAIGRYGGGPTELILELTDAGYVHRGTPAEARQIDELELISAILSESPEAATPETIQSHWAVSPRIGLRRLRNLLQEGAEQGRWHRSGSGTRGDPTRYGLGDEPPDSIPFSSHPLKEPGIESFQPTMSEIQQVHRGERAPKTCPKPN